jgi:radical SAM protein with 4Fe4S-binding SPASM domain
MSNILAAVYETTLECNLRCKHCGSSAGTKRQYELNTLESKLLLNQLQELGCKNISFSGGEPFLRQDITELLQYSTDLGMDTGIITNGIYLSNNNLEFLSKNGKIVVGISLDGSKNVHNNIRGEGAYEKTISTIKELKEYNIETTIITTLSKSNLNNLDTLLVINLYLGIDSWQLQVASPMGNMDINKTLNNEEYIMICNKINKFRKEYSNILNIQGADCLGIGNRKLTTDYNLNGCQAGLSAIGIRSNGDIYGCLSLQFPEFFEGNIREKSLKEIWENPEGFKYNRTLRTYEGKCKTCNIISDCKAGCTSINKGHGNINKSPYCIK